MAVEVICLWLKDFAPFASKLCAFASWSFILNGRACSPLRAAACPPTRPGSPGRRARSDAPYRLVMIHAHLWAVANFGIAQPLSWFRHGTDIAGIVAAITESELVAVSEKAYIATLVDRDSSTRWAGCLAVQSDCRLSFHLVQQPRPPFAKRTTQLGEPISGGLGSLTHSGA